DSPRIDTADPYLIAYLRGGANETLRVATVSLIDRGMLVVDATNDEVSARHTKAEPRRPIEQAIVRHFAQPHAATTVFGHPVLLAACQEYQRYLAGRGLLPSPGTRARCAALLLVALAVLGGLSLTKIIVAFSRGRTNIGFLMILTAVSFGVAFAVALP